MKLILSYVKGKGKGKGKAVPCRPGVAQRFPGKSVPLHAWSGPEGSGKLRSLDYVTMAQDGGTDCQPYVPADFTPRKYSGYSFLLEAESTPGP